MVWPTVIVPPVTLVTVRVLPGLIEVIGVDGETNWGTLTEYASCVAVIAVDPIDWPAPLSE
jgi:hypothetical protein